MADLKQKQKDLKNINGETELAGAPFYGNDFVRLQQNAKADYINAMEALRRRLPLVQYSGAPVHGAGLILSGLEYSAPAGGPFVISEGYLLLDGEVCYYPGGTIVPVTENFSLYFRKGALTTESRVFADGGSKEFLVEYAVEVEQSTTDANGPVLPGGWAPGLSDDIVILTMGTNSYTLGEDHHTINAALEVNRAQKRIAVTQMFDANPSTGFSAPTVGRLLASRVMPDGSTFFCGRVMGQTDGSPIQQVASLDAQGKNPGSDPFTLYPVNMLVTKVTDPLEFQSGIEAHMGENGVINIVGPDGTNLPAAGTDYYFTFSGTIMLNRDSYTEEYTYKEDFLNITP